MIEERLGNWLIAQGRSRLVPGHGNRDAIAARIDALKRLWVLADAPMFIDGQQVERLFDAIFRPEFEVASRTSSRDESRTQERSVELAASIEVSVPAFFKYSAKGKAAEKMVKTQMHGESVLAMAVKSPERRLETLLNLYVYSYPERLFWVESSLVSVSQFDGVKADWATMEQTLVRPGIRPIVVFDLARDTRMIPMF